MKSIYQNRTEPFTIRITQNNSYAPHLHREIELFYVLNGEIEITIGSTTQILSAGMASIAFPNVAHKTHTETSSRAILVIFPPELLPDYHKEFSSTLPASPFVTAPSDPKRLHHLFMELLACQEGTAFKASPALKKDGLLPVKSYLALILWLILSDIVLLPGTTVSSDICEEIAAYLNGHFTEPLSLSDLAFSLGYSKYYISHIFRDSFGCSYTDYLNRLRCEHAMGLLMHTDLSVTDACYASGFNSLRTFYRSFAQVYDTTPGKPHAGA